MAREPAIRQRRAPQKIARPIAPASSPSAALPRRGLPRRFGRTTLPALARTIASPRPAGPRGLVPTARPASPCRNAPPNRARAAPAGSAQQRRYKIVLVYACVSCSSNSLYQNEVFPYANRFNIITSLRGESNDRREFDSTKQSLVKSTDCFVAFGSLRSPNAPRNDSVKVLLHGRSINEIRN